MSRQKYPLFYMFNTPSILNFQILSTIDAIYNYDNILFVISKTGKNSELFEIEMKESRKRSAKIP